MSLARFSSHTFRWLLSSCIFVPSDSSAFWKALDWPSGHQAWAHTAILPSLPSWSTTCRDHLLAEDGNSVSKSTQVLALSTSNKDQFFLRLLHLFFFFPPNSVESISQLVHCRVPLHSSAVGWVHFQYLLATAVVISANVAVLCIWFLWTPSREVGMWLLHPVSAVTFHVTLG